MMRPLKRRLEDLEDLDYVAQCRALAAYLRGRTETDVEFFILHGYLPEASLPGPAFDSSEVLRNTTREDRKQTERLIREMAGRSNDDVEVLLKTGHWPEQIEARRES